MTSTLSGTVQNSRQGHRQARDKTQARGASGELWNHRSTEMVIQIYLSDFQEVALRFASRPASMTIAEAVKCNP